MFIGVSEGTKKSVLLALSRGGGVEGVLCRQQAPSTYKNAPFQTKRALTRLLQGTMQLSVQEKQ